MRSFAVSTPVIQLTLSAPGASKGEAASPATSANTAPRPHAAFSSVCHYWCHFLVANTIVTHNQWCSAVTWWTHENRVGELTNQSTVGSQGGGGRSSNKPFRTESEYTYYTEMLYEKPMWFWNIEQCKSILVDLNNGIMISRNAHDMGPLRSMDGAPPTQMACNFNISTQSPSEMVVPM